MDPVMLRLTDGFSRLTLDDAQEAIRDPPSISTPETQALELLMMSCPATALNEHCSEILGAWIRLQRATDFPDNLASTHVRVATAFKATIDAIREGGVFARIAHIRLLDVFAKVERLISSERRLGLQPAEKNTKIVIDTFMAIVRPEVWPRHRVIELRRTARRWRYLAGNSVFTLMIYSELAEPMV